MHGSLDRFLTPVMRVVSCFSNQHLNLAVLGQSGHLYKLFSTLFLHICKSLFIFDRYCVALEHFLQTY